MSKDELASSSDRALGQALLSIARSAVGTRFGLCRVSEPADPALSEPGATFVTLKREGELRGCIGSLDAVRPLGIDVRENAIAAAFRDPRFPGLMASEYASTTFEVSLLSPPQRIAFASERDLLGKLEQGVDGVVLEFESRRATFLPQVWDGFATACAFVAALKRKAGLQEDFWSPELKVSRYRVTKWAEAEFPEIELTG